MKVYRREWVQLHKLKYTHCVSTSNYRRHFSKNDKNIARTTKKTLFTPWFSSNCASVFCDWCWVHWGGGAVLRPRSLRSAQSTHVQVDHRSKNRGKYRNASCWREQNALFFLSQVLEEILWKVGSLISIKLDTSVTQITWAEQTSTPLSPYFSAIVNISIVFSCFESTDPHSTLRWSIWKRSHWPKLDTLEWSYLIHVRQAEHSLHIIRENYWSGLSIEGL